MPNVLRDSGSLSWYRAQAPDQAIAAFETRLFRTPDLNAYRQRNKRPQGPIPKEQPRDPAR